MSFSDRAASFLGVVIPCASSLGMISCSPRPVSQLSMYFISPHQSQTDSVRGGHCGSQGAQVTPPDGQRLSVWQFGAAATSAVQVQ